MFVLALSAFAAATLVAAVPLAHDLLAFDIDLSMDEIVSDLAEGFERGEA